MKIIAMTIQLPRTSPKLLAAANTWLWKYTLSKKSCFSWYSNSQVSIYVAVAHQTSPAPDTQITNTDGRALCQTDVKFCQIPLV